MSSYSYLSGFSHSIYTSQILGTKSNLVHFLKMCLLTKNRAIRHHRERMLWSNWIIAFGPALHQKVRTQPDMCHLSAFCLQTEFF